MAAKAVRAQAPAVAAETVQRPVGVDPEAVYLVVTTAHRGVFGGWGRPTDGETIRLEHASMAVYWSIDVASVVGLAATGPTDRCRIGPAAPAIILRDVTAVMVASPKAAAAWARQPWSR